MILAEIKSRHRNRLLDLHEVAEALRRGEDVTIARFGADVCPDDRDPDNRLRRALALARDLGVEIGMAPASDVEVEQGTPPFAVSCPDVLALRRLVEIGLKKVDLETYGRRTPARKRKVVRRLQQEALARGLCTTCRKNAREGDYTQCPECRERRTENTADEREKLSTLGICVACKVAPSEGKVMCRPCASKLLATQKRTKDARKARGECYLCPRDKVAPAEDGLKTCRGCREKANAEARRGKKRRCAEKLSRGICERDGCREPVARCKRPGHESRPIRRCEKHRAELNQRKNRREVERREKGAA